MSSKKSSAVKNDVDNNIINNDYTTGQEAGSVIKDVVDSNINTEDLDGGVIRGLRDDIRMRGKNPKQDPYGPPLVSNYQYSPHPGADNPVLTVSDVDSTEYSNSPQFVADPFLFYENGIWYMFFEVKSDTGPQHLAYATSKDGLNWTYQSKIVDQSDAIANGALSYPYVFKWNGEYYMTPNQSGYNEMALWKANNFPTDWVVEENLFSFSNIGSGKDPTPFLWNDKWWVIYSSSDTLYARYSDNLVGGSWTEHPSNPIRSGDLAGRAIVRDSHIEIPNDTSRGVGMIVINELTTTSFDSVDANNSPVVKPVTASEPGGGNDWNRGNMHHMDSWESLQGRGLAVVDGFDTASGSPNGSQSDYAIGIYQPYSGPPIHYDSNKSQYTFFGENTDKYTKFRTEWREWIFSAQSSSDLKQKNVARFREIKDSVFSSGRDGFRWVPGDRDHNNRLVISKSNNNPIDTMIISSGKGLNVSMDRANSVPFQNDRILNLLDTNSTVQSYIEKSGLFFINGGIRNADFNRNVYSSNSTLNLISTDADFQFIDPNLSTITVQLPNISPEGVRFYIFNEGSDSGNDLINIEDNAGNSIIQLDANEFCMTYSNGNRRYVMGPLTGQLG